MLYHGLSVYSCAAVFEYAPSGSLPSVVQEDGVALHHGSHAPAHRLLFGEHAKGVEVERGDDLPILSEPRVCKHLSFQQSAPSLSRLVLLAEGLLPPCVNRCRYI